MSPSTLFELVRVGDGPPRIRLSAGMIRYRSTDIDQWLDQHVEARPPAP
jgi:predicted DNA-binding transcriptional regulator AlpA